MLPKDSTAPQDGFPGTCKGQDCCFTRIQRNNIDCLEVVGYRMEAHGLERRSAGEPDTRTRTGTGTALMRGPETHERLAICCEAFVSSQGPCQARGFPTGLSSWKGYS
ncbi:hypothetical protein SKAU_G00028620 [Synaphobranchus kaupii]|uniref:Uncharacterized protein n=1 Tax=Synaphobranchus kaupii TaxID=118154 RepID=A0A9Q1GDC7_SYNKA|nr:hypothetical protein SKAU_G00028620 [Synaphobranchus kaupii]